MTIDRERLLAGDLATTFRCTTLIERWIRRTFHKSSQVAGLIQTTMIEIFTKLQDPERIQPEPERMDFFVLGCANNVVRRELTRLKHVPVEAFDSRQYARAAPNPSSVLDHRRELEQVDHALKARGERAQQVLLSRMSGASYEEICAELGGDPDATRSLVARERRKLESWLDAEARRALLLREVARMRMNSTSGS